MNHSPLPASTSRQAPRGSDSGASTSGPTTTLRPPNVNGAEIRHPSTHDSVPAKEPSARTSLPQRQGMSRPRPTRGPASPRPRRFRSIAVSTRSAKSCTAAAPASGRGSPAAARTGARSASSGHSVSTAAGGAQEVLLAGLCPQRGSKSRRYRSTPHASNGSTSGNAPQQRRRRGSIQAHHARIQHGLAIAVDGPSGALLFQRWLLEVNADQSVVAGARRRRGRAASSGITSAADRDQAPAIQPHRRSIDRDQRVAGRHHHLTRSGRAFRQRQEDGHQPVKTGSVVTAPSLSPGKGRKIFAARPIGGQTAGVPTGVHDENTQAPATPLRRLLRPGLP